jgi:hypothetical protein
MRSPDPTKDGVSSALVLEAVTRAGTSAPASPQFDRSSAVAALSTAILSASTCSSGRSVPTRFTVTFFPWGRVSRVLVDEQSPLANPKMGQCVVRALLKARTPSFFGDPVSVRFSAPAPY